MQASVKWGYYTGPPGKMNGVQWRPGVNQRTGAARDHGICGRMDVTAARSRSGRLGLRDRP